MSGRTGRISAMEKTQSFAVGPLARLSERESDVARRYADGRTYKEIAEALFISPATVRNHLAHIYRKLEINGKAELARIVSESRAGVGAGGGLVRPAKPSIAVLPFENMSGDPEQEFFSDGVVEDIITDLSRIEGLFVIARNSTFAYKGSRIDIRDVCADLGVRYVLEGSVRRADDRVRITAQLIDGDSGGHVWAERYDRNLHDIFSVQDDVTGKIVNALALQLTRDERARLRRRPTENLEAYEHFLRGRDQAFRDTPQTNAQARAQLEEAIALDPGFSLAFSHLSRNHVIAYVNQWDEAPERCLEMALELAEHAIALDEGNPHAFFALAAAALWSKRHQEAAAAARRCIESEPNFAEGHAVLGLVLVYAGEPRKAIESLEHAMRLDPHYRDIYLHLLGLAHFQLGDYERSVEALKRRLVRKPETDISRVLLAAAYGHLGLVDESRTQWQEAHRINPKYSLEHRRTILPFKNPAHFESIVAGLAKADLCEEIPVEGR